MTMTGAGQFEFFLSRDTRGKKPDPLPLLPRAYYLRDNILSV